MVEGREKKKKKNIFVSISEIIYSLSDYLLIIIIIIIILTIPSKYHFLYVASL